MGRHRHRTDIPIARSTTRSTTPPGAARTVGSVVAGFALLVGVAACGTEGAVPTALDSAGPTTSATTTSATPTPTSAIPTTTSAPAADLVVAPVRTAPPRRAPGSVASRPRVTPKPAPRPVPALPSGGGVGNTYTNSDGNQVERPDGNSAGATAVCKDGTDSHSQHRSGTCSGHGGVARWL